MNLVKLTPKEFRKLADGKLVYIEHPEKGMVYVDYSNIFVNTKDLEK